MEFAKPLPSYLVTRYHGWKATTYSENQVWFKRLADEGQRPRAMVISCCDSRVHVTSMFGADQGDFFIHRNIANLVPPYAPDGNLHGTSAALEYAVTALKVAHVVVLGHSQCGGVKGCIDMCQGHAPQLESKESFVGAWMSILKPKFADVADISDPDEQATALEKLSVLASLDNLMTFPFVKERVEAGSLTLHGLWNNIGEGSVEAYVPERDAFEPL